MKQGTFNQTAYRILMLLRWLTEKPLSYAEINERFEAEPGIFKKVSSDTLWFYINTLKALGCEISRPTARNNYCYQLKYHPFNYFLTPQDIQTLKDTFYSMDETIDYWSFIYFTQWLKRLFEHAVNKNTDELRTRFFQEMRLVDFAGQEKHLLALEHFCQQSQLLHLQYLKNQDIKVMNFLPEKIFHQQGVLYIQGQSADRAEVSMLRLDRIQQMTPFTDDDLLKRLLERQHRHPIYVIRLLHCNVKDYEPFTSQDEILAEPDGENAPHLLVRFAFDNAFLLKQRLLTCGYLFQVLAPDTFKQDVETTLHAMQERYAHEA